MFRRTPVGPAPCDFNFAEVFRLCAEELFEPDQFQQRQKGADHFGTATAPANNSENFTTACSALI